MSNVLAEALVPIFAGLLLGYLAGYWGILDNQNVRSLITFVMSFAVPSAIFLSIARTPRAQLREQMGVALVLVLVYALLYAITFFWVRSAEKLTSSETSVVALTVSFPNSAAVGLPLLAAVLGEKSLVTVATSIALGAITITAITLAILESKRDHSGPAFSFRDAGRRMLRSAKAPVVWAPVLGFVFSAAELRLPSSVDRSLALLGAAAPASALVLTGLVVSAQMFAFRWSTLVPVVLKNILQPALALGIAIALGLSTEQIRAVTLICAVPCGFFGLIFGKSFDATPKLASSGLISSYVIGVATLAFWIVIVSQLR